jgi:hypothetical protein
MEAGVTSFYRGSKAVRRGGDRRVKRGGNELVIILTVTRCGGGGVAKLR